MAQASYARTLRNLAKKITHVLATNDPAKAEDILRRYVKEVEPWAEAKARDMLAQVSRDNANQFKRLSRQMGLDMRAFLRDATVGKVASEILRQNINLITSLPKRAAEEAGKLAHESLVTGMRADDITAEIRKLGAKTEYQAKRIALTEISKAHTALTRARAIDVGSEGYIWRTAHDGGVRESHKGMEGKFVPWDKPPTLDKMTGHAGEFPFCRCYPEPVIPKNDETKIAFKPFLPVQENDPATRKVIAKTGYIKPDPVEHALKMVKGAPIPLDKAADANPNHGRSKDFRVNCQRCVPTFEYRRRGYDLEALSRSPDTLQLGMYSSYSCFENPVIVGRRAGKNQTPLTKKDLLDHLKALPEGSRIGVCWTWAGGKEGHTIAAEIQNGKVVFIDPQNGQVGDSVLGIPNSDGFSYFRMDNLELKKDLIDKIFKKRTTP